MEQISSLRQEVAMKRERVVPGKYGISTLMLELKEAEIKIRGYTSTYAPQIDCKTNLKDKGEIPTGAVHAEHINKTTTLPIPIE